MKLLLTFDLEEFVANEFGLNIEKNKLFEISKKGFNEILKLLKKHKVKATFFTTLEFAEYCPKLIEEAIKDGHEIGLHALKHEHRYNKMSEQDAYKFLKKAKTSLEKRFKIKIVSFRAPQMSRPSYEVLKKFLLEAKNNTELNNMRFGVLLIPSKERVLYNYLTQMGYNVPKEYKKLVNNEDELKENISLVLENTKISFIDILPDMENAILEYGNIYPVSYDGHPIEIGYQIYADNAFKLYQQLIK